MDLGVRNELPKMAQDTRFLLEHQRLKRDGIQKECDEYETRIIYLKDKIKEIEDRIFNTQMGEKIKELVKENLSLSIDAQCLSIVLDIYNQGMDRGVADNYRNSPVHPTAISPNHPMATGSPMGMMPRVNTPTNSNVVTLDTTSYPYATLMSPNMSPYPVQQGLPTLPYPMTGMPQLAPHPHDTSRQLSMGPHHAGHPNFYNYGRQGSLNILTQVPPPGGWIQQQNFPVSPTPNLGPPVPPRPSDLHIPARNRSGRNLPTPPQRPVPPPPTPPKPTRSPNLERPRSSNDMIDQREDDNLVWKCSKCTFDNHSAMNLCEMCGNSRGPNVGSIGPHNNRSPN